MGGDGISGMSRVTPHPLTPQGAVGLFRIGGVFSGVMITASDLLFRVGFL